MILLCGLENDTPIHLVREVLIEKKIKHLFLNQADILESHLEIKYLEEPNGILSVYNSKYNVEDFTALYLRPYDFRKFPQFENLTETSDEWHHAIAFEDILWGFAEITRARVLNRPSTMLSNGSKPYQSMLIEKAGFKTPVTLLTTDINKVLKFKKKYGKLIYKSISSSRSIVNALGDNDIERMEDLHWCPTQFQNYIPGEEFRVHVIGKQIFASRIISDATDYRYGVSTFEPAELPGTVADTCISLSVSLGLELAGIDLRLTPEGEWFCFEVNPSPAYSVFENSTSQRISHAIAEYLSST